MPAKIVIAGFVLSDTTIIIVRKAGYAGRSSNYMDTKNMRLMRYKDACEAIGLGRNKVRELAKQAKAMYKIDKAVVIDMNKLVAYLDEYYLVDADNDK